MLVYCILKKTLNGNPNLTYEEQTNKQTNKVKNKKKTYIYIYIYVYTCENKLEQRRIKQKN